MAKERPRSTKRQEKVLGNLIMGGQRLPELFEKAKALDMSGPELMRWIEQMAMATRGEGIPTQRHLAGFLGVTRETVNRWLNSEKVPRLPLLALLATAAYIRKHLVVLPKGLVVKPKKGA